MTDRFGEGIIFFNSGRYFDAHEAWEDVWRESDGPLRLFYQGLVQAAVGLHHLGKGNLNGAVAQLTKSLSKLDMYPQDCCRIDNLKLTVELRKILEDREPRQIVIARL